MRSCGKEVHGLIIYSMMKCILFICGIFIPCHLVISLDTLFFLWSLGSFCVMKYFLMGPEGTFRLWPIASFSRLKPLKLSLDVLTVQLSKFHIVPSEIDPIAKTGSGCL